MKKTIREITEFSTAAFKWMQQEQGNSQTPLAKAIFTIMPKLSSLTEPYILLEENYEKKLTALLKKSCDEVWVEKEEGQRGQAPRITTRHIFKSLISFDEYEAEVKKMEEFMEKEREEVMNIQVDVEPVYTTEMPPFKQFPENIQEPFIGFVIPEKKEKKLKKA
jgi:hypothetical protein